MPAGERVLVADDDRDILDLIVFKLDQAGYNVTAVTNGAAALAALEDDPPDVAVLDVMMPGLSGIEVVKRLRAAQRDHAPKVLLLTARARDIDVDTGYRGGADDYMVKPFSPRELVHRIESLLSRHGDGSGRHN